MSFEEVIKSYYGKSVRIVDVDGEEFVGLFSQYEYSTDDPDEQDIIAIAVDGYYIEFPFDEVESIEEAGDMNG